MLLKVCKKMYFNEYTLTYTHVRTHLQIKAYFSSNCSLFVSYFFCIKTKKFKETAKKKEKEKQKEKEKEKEK